MASKTKILVKIALESLWESKKYGELVRVHKIDARGVHFYKKIGLDLFVQPKVTFLRNYKLFRG